MKKYLPHVKEGLPNVLEGNAMSELGTSRGIPDGRALRIVPIEGVAVAGSSATFAATGQRRAATDVITHDPAALAIVYSQFAAALRQSQSGRSELSAADTGLPEALLQHHGSALTALVGALPTALRAAFLSRLAAATTQPRHENADQERVGNPPAKAELAAAIAAGVAGTNDAAASLAAARLAIYVAYFGLDAATQLLLPPGATPPACERTQILAPNALTPPAPTVDPGHKRRQEEQRRRRESERNEEVEVADEKPAGYTIDDIVQFAGETVARRRTDPTALGHASPR